jgi:hypothetical protein
MGFLDPKPVTTAGLDAATAALAANPASDLAGELSSTYDPIGAAAAAAAPKLNSSVAATTYVKFVDLAGNPITARHVTIKVDTSTWEINDIIAEA